MGGGLSKDVLESKHVCIIGGGYGGMAAAARLKELGIPFTLIDKKEYFYHMVGVLRGLVEPDYLPKIMIDFKTSFGDSFIQGEVTNVDFEGKVVSLASGKSVNYTDLVIAVGNTGPFPSIPNDNQNAQADFTEACRQLSQELEKSESVLIVGGGAVGVELAGEIAETYPDKKVTLVHSGTTLVTMEFGQKFQDQINAAIEKYQENVKIIKEDRLSNLNSVKCSKNIKQNLKTEKGVDISCDIVFNCTGLRPNTSLTKKIFGEDMFDSNGRLVVDETLQLVGRSGVYAIGDCCGTPETKMGAHAAKHGTTVADNLIRELKGQEKTSYKQEFNGMLLTFGKGGGAGIINGWHWPSVMVSMVKGGSLFTPKYWSTMGQKMPS